MQKGDPMNLKDRVEALLSEADNYEAFSESCKRIEIASANLRAFNSLKVAQLKGTENSSDDDQEAKHCSSGWSSYKPASSISHWNRL